jgi:hypothetical protein
MPGAMVDRHGILISEESVLWSDTFVIVGLLVLSCATPLEGQGLSKDNLANMLATEQTRKDAVAFVVSSGNTYVPLLLSWTRTAPPGVNMSQLYVGLADAFGELKTEEAIPFLIGNISMERTRVSLSVSDPWDKGPDVVEARLPAVAALIRIGPPSAKATYPLWWHMSDQDRLAGMYVIARVGEQREASDFFKGVRAQL